MSPIDLHSETCRHRIAAKTHCSNVVHPSVYRNSLTLVAFPRDSANAVETSGLTCDGPRSSLVVWPLDMIALSAMSVEKEKENIRVHQSF